MVRPDEVTDLKMMSSYKPNYETLLKDLMYRRNHPFYDDWKDWQDIVYNYHSERVARWQKLINKGKMGEWDCHIDSHYTMQIPNEIFTKVAISRSDFISKNSDQSDLDFWTCELKLPLVQDSCWWCDCYESIVRQECRFYADHLRAHYIGVMWAYANVMQITKRQKKYYSYLERVILSLNLRQLRLFSFDLILKPDDYIKRRRNLLRELYNRSVFDGLKINDFVQNVERVKHFIPKEQSGTTSQCISDVSLFPEEFIPTAQRIFEQCSLDDVLKYTRVRQQGLFSIDHNVKVPTEELDKFKDMLQDTQRSFLAEMKETLLTTGKTLIVLFATAGTVALLCKVTASIGITLILKILQLIYSLLFGPETSELIDRSSRIMQQSGSGISIPFLPGMILNYVISPPKDIVSKIWRNPSIDMILRRLGYLGDPKIERGIERITEWVKNMIHSVQVWYYREILGTSIPDRLDTASHPIEEWHREVDELITSYYNDTFMWSETSWSVVYNLYSRGLRFTREAAYARWKNDVWKIVTKLGNLLEKFKLHQRSGQSIRNPPVTIYMSGGTGVGKSSITYPLAAEVLKGIFEKEKNPTDLAKYWKNLIYMRSAEQEFWDGYENQLVTVFDDFNQQTDSASNPNLELFEIIRASNCFPYPLHMADIAQKANTSFTSKILIVSSNLSKPRTQSLNFPAALERRFDISIRVSRKPEFQGKRLSKFDPHIYEFERYDMQSNVSLGKITYKELVELCVMEYFARRDFVDSLNDYIEESLGPKINPNELDIIDEYIDDEVPIQQGPVGDLVMNRLRRNRIEQVTRNFVYHRDAQVTGYEFPSEYDDFWDLLKGCYYSVKNKIFGEDPWLSLKRTCDGFKKHCVALSTSWARFRSEHPYLSTAMMIVSMITTGLIFLKIFSKFSNLGKIDKRELIGVAGAAKKLASPEGYSLPKPPVPKVEGYTNPSIKVAKVESIEFDPKTGLPLSQGVKDLNAAEILLSIARRNLYKMYESTCGAPIGHVFFLKGKIAIMPKHYIGALRQSLKNDPDATVYFKAVLLSRAFELRVSDLLKDMKPYCSPEEEGVPLISKDLMAVHVGTSIVHPDSTPYFCNKESLSRVDYTQVMLPVLMENNIGKSERDCLLLRFAEGRSTLQRCEQLPVGDEQSVVVRYIRDAWQYDMDTRPTECGAPLIVRNSRIAPGKICGLHVAGLEGTGQGFATPLYEEDVKVILSMFPEEKQFAMKQRILLEEFPKEQCQIPESAEFLRLGSLRKPVHQPSKTTIEPSLCFGYKEPETKPCQLRPDDDFDPRAYRLGRLGNVTQAIPSGIIENAKQALLDEISSVLSKTSDVYTNDLKAVYTFEEAIQGIDGEPYVNSIKRTTSPGYPFVHLPGFENRKRFFGEEGVNDLSSRQALVLRKRVNDIIENAKQGIVLDHYFCDTLKDERKPIHKAHKTRLFSAGPLDYLVVCKMYFNGVVALLQRNRNWSHVSVGTNPYSEDWGEIVKCLQRKSELMIAGDFEGFDASQHQSLLEACGEIFVELSKRFLHASEEDVKVMRVLLVSLFNSLHITGKEVYQWTHSLPSGHYLTAPINSVFVDLAFTIIWQICFGEESYAFARLFFKECGIVAYGDDHILAVPPSRIDKFNQFTIPALFQKIGLSYTMEDKDAIVTRPFRRIEEISYLKREFRKDEETGRWLAPLSLKTVLETPMWLHKCPDRRAQTIENLDWALKELSLHDQDVWNQWSPKLFSEQRKLGYFTTFWKQEDARVACLSQTLEM